MKERRIWGKATRLRLLNLTSICGLILAWKHQFKNVFRWCADLKNFVKKKLSVSSTAVHLCRSIFTSVAISLQHPFPFLSRLTHFPFATRLTVSRFVSLFLFGWLSGPTTHTHTIVCATMFIKCDRERNNNENRLCATLFRAISTDSPPICIMKLGVTNASVSYFRLRIPNWKQIRLKGNFFMELCCNVCRFFSLLLLVIRSLVWLNVLIDNKCVHGFCFVFAVSRWLKCVFFRQCISLHSVELGQKAVYYILQIILIIASIYF